MIVTDWPFYIKLFNPAIRDLLIAHSKLVSDPRGSERIDPLELGPIYTHLHTRKAFCHFTSEDV
jgi:hypothetical protein